MNGGPGILTGEAVESGGKWSSTTAAASRQGWKLYQTIRYLLRWLRWWVRLEVRGLEHLPATGPVLVVSNHDAWLDPLVMLE